MADSGNRHGAGGRGRRQSLRPGVHRDRFALASEAGLAPKNIQTQEERVYVVFAVKMRVGNSGRRLSWGILTDAALLY